MEKDMMDEFDEICAKLNISHLNKAYAIEKFKEVTESTLLDVSSLRLPPKCVAKAAGMCRWEKLT